MRHYLTAKTGEIPRIDEVYDAFKHYAQAAFGLAGASEGIEPLVKEIRDFAGFFCAMALGTEQDPALKKAFGDLRELKVDVAFPFLLDLYADYKAGVISPQDCLRAVRLVEAYVFRRAVCSIPTNSMNKTFAGFMKAVRKDRYLESIEAQFLLLPSYRRFPSDDEFHRDLQQRDLYNFRSRAYWLRKFENHDRKEVVPVEEYTIEHILPQNENLGHEWQAELGEDWQRVQQTWLHTLGNLTLTAYNAEYSDRPFADKRDRAGGFKDSPLRLNKGLGQTPKWDEAAIRQRAAILASRAVEVWPSPKLAPEALEQCRERKGPSASYSIENHPHLLSPTVRPLFEAFRKAVLALDPCVTEEFLKLYVAYKAETNFADVVPQAKGLKVVLNIRFADISDPKGLCEDVTGLGRWGNGDVSIKVGSLDDLPYAIGLVRQALDQQLGASGDT
jgi:predicted transport protein